MVNGDVKTLFLDTNILIYMEVTESPWHQTALRRVQHYHHSGSTLWISRQVLREYLVSVTHPNTFAVPLPLGTAIKRVRYFETLFHIAEDGPQVTTNLLKLLEETTVVGKRIHDVNIVATMQHVGVRHLLTHNSRDFAHFVHHITLLPLIPKDE